MKRKTTTKASDERYITTRHPAHDFTYMHGGMGENIQNDLDDPQPMNQQGPKGHHKEDE